MRYCRKSRGFSFCGKVLSLFSRFVVLLAELLPDILHSATVFAQIPIATPGLGAAFYYFLSGVQVELPVIDETYESFELDFAPITGCRRISWRARSRKSKSWCQILYNKCLGIDFTIEQLEALGFKAIFIAMGCHCHRRLGIEGESGLPSATSPASFSCGISISDS